MYRAFDESGASAWYPPPPLSHRWVTALWVFQYYMLQLHRHSHILIASWHCWPLATNGSESLSSSSCGCYSTLSYDHLKLLRSSKSLTGEALSWVHNGHAPMSAKPGRPRQVHVAPSLAKHVKGWLAAVHQWAPRIALAYHHQEWAVLLTANHKFRF